MLRISSLGLVAFSPSSDIRALKSVFAIRSPYFEIEFQFHFNPSAQSCQWYRKEFILSVNGEK
jgi:hypothetical protein